MNLQLVDDIPSQYPRCLWGKRSDFDSTNETCSYMNCNHVDVHELSFASNAYETGPVDGPNAN